MARPRYENFDPARQQKLLDAAAAEFAAHGYELASVNRILDAAGVSKGLFYYYFDDKADLAATLIADEGNLAVKGMAELRLPNTADEFWLELRRNTSERIKVMAARRTRYESLLRLANAMAKDHALAQRVLPLFDEGRKIIGEFFQRAQHLGAVRKDLPLPLLIEMVESLKMTLYRAQFPGDRVPTEAELESFSDLMLDFARRLLVPVIPGVP